MNGKKARLLRKQSTNLARKDNIPEESHGIYKDLKRTFNSLNWKERSYVSMKIEEDLEKSNAKMESNKIEG